MADQPGKVPRRNSPLFNGEREREGERRCLGGFASKTCGERNKGARWNLPSDTQVYLCAFSPSYSLAPCRWPNSVWIPSLFWAGVFCISFLHPPFNNMATNIHILLFLADLAVSFNSLAFLRKSPHCSLVLLLLFSHSPPSSQPNILVYTSCGKAPKT